MDTMKDIKRGTSWKYVLQFVLSMMDFQMTAFVAKQVTKTKLLREYSQLLRFKSNWCNDEIYKQISPLPPVKDINNRTFYALASPIEFGIPIIQGALKYLPMQTPIAVTKHASISDDIWYLLCVDDILPGAEIITMDPNFLDLAENPSLCNLFDEFWENMQYPFYSSENPDTKFYEPWINMIKNGKRLRQHPLGIIKVSPHPVKKTSSLKNMIRRNMTTLDWSMFVFHINQYCRFTSQLAKRQDSKIHWHI